MVGMGEGRPANDVRPMDSASHGTEVPAEYRHTEVGGLPEDWGIERIDRHAFITTGAKNTQDKREGGIHPFFVRSQEVERIDTYSYDGEAVLTAGDGVGTGKVFHYIRGRFDVHQRVYRITGFSDRLNGRYFFYQFSERFYDRIMSMTAKSSVDSVRLEMIAGMRIPMPPTPEQRAIAAVLSDVDELIRSLEALIAKKRAIKQAAMQELLTGRTRLPGFGGEWEMVELRECARIRNRKVAPVEVGADTPCVELEHIGQGDGRLASHGTAGRSSSTKYRFEPRDILFGRLRPYLRKWWYSDRCGVCSTEIWPLDVDRSKAESRFVYAFVQTDRFLEAAETSYGTHMPRADWNIVSRIQIPLPPLPEQRAIATILSDMDSEIAALERRLDKTRAIKQGMMQQLLTGSIRLPIPDDDTEDHDAHDA